MEKKLSLKRNPLTYISLFSSAGVGCYGFKQESFECIATNEVKSRRLDIQRYNKKCKYESGYILGDISDDNVKEQFQEEINKWKFLEGLTDVDVILATPPCQGMSIVNQKKNHNDKARNSLVVESIKIVSNIKPKIFIFENVPAFLKTFCTDIDKRAKSIDDAIKNNLGKLYSIHSKTINFKDFGASSSRSRTIVIGVRNDLADNFSPIEIYPNYKTEISLRECIGALKPLITMGEIDENDIYHNFRVYPEQMRNWIVDLKEGGNAFENIEPLKKPHRIIEGKIVLNKQKNGDKYKRQFWDKVGPCIHTRNDQLASQNTIHPSDDRVFSIRELMNMMTVPDCFLWSEKCLKDLNYLEDAEKRIFLKKNEMNIRQSLGEAVPTEIFRAMAIRIKELLMSNFKNDNEIRNIIKIKNLMNKENLVEYIRNNPDALGFSTLSRISELACINRVNREAYYTNKSLITEIFKNLPENNKEAIHILEPSVGSGNFIPFIIKHFEKVKNLKLTVVDIDSDVLDILKELVRHLEVPENVEIEYICSDYLSTWFCGNYDFVIGNPPFAKDAREVNSKGYRNNSLNKNAVNTSAFFIEKAVNQSDFVAMVMPKFLLNTSEFKTTRDFLNKFSIECIIDFGEKGFGGVLIETIGILINKKSKPQKTKIISLLDNEVSNKNQKYITSSDFPYWLIYRDTFFDDFCKKMQLNIFNVYRDRQITNSLLNTNKKGIRIIKSRNINEDGSALIDIDGYDNYLEKEIAEKLAVYKYLDDDTVYLAPNMTYKPRLIKKPKGVLVNGSTAILLLKEGQKPLSREQMMFLASKEYRDFYKIARNKQTRSLNIDSDSVFFWGRVIKDYE